MRKKVTHNEIEKKRSRNKAEQKSVLDAQMLERDEEFCQPNFCFMLASYKNIEQLMWDLDDLKVVGSECAKMLKSGIKSRKNSFIKLLKLNPAFKPLCKFSLI